MADFEGIAAKEETSIQKVMVLVAYYEIVELNSRMRANYVINHT